MKNLLTFGEFIQINEAFASFDGSFRGTLAERLKGIKEDEAEMGEGVVDMKLLTTQYELIAKSLKVPMNKIAYADSEDNYELVEALSVGLRKRFDAQDQNIKIMNEFNFNSPWHSAAVKRPLYYYHIADANLDVMAWTDGDDFADFNMIAFPVADKKKLVDWVNKNMTKDDMQF
jgi:hypothetical protein